jgi:hypothetical protein
MANSDHRRDAGIRATVGEKPQLATIALYDTDGEAPSRAQVASGQGGKANKMGKLNLRAVADVLESYGLDPIEEIAKVITATEEARARDGTVIKDVNGQPIIKPVLDNETRLKTLVELAQYTRPKLKSVEVNMKGPELTDEQVDKRIQALMARTAKSKE